MASAFGRKIPIMDSGEYTTVKKAKSIFYIHPRVNENNLTRAAIFSYPGVSDRIIISAAPRSGAASSAPTRILSFSPDPTNPKRFIQNLS